MTTRITTHVPFADRLRELREAAGLSVYALAQRASLSRQYVGRLEAGLMSPGWETLCALADALGVPIGDFRTQKKSPKKP